MKKILITLALLAGSLYAASAVEFPAVYTYNTNKVQERFDLNVQVPDEALAERRKSYVKPEPNVKSGWLARYSTLVSSAKDGAVMKKVF